jgi:hypothetical protein
MYSDDPESAKGWMPRTDEQLVGHDLPFDEIDGFLLLQWQSVNAFRRRRVQLHNALGPN